MFEAMAISWLKVGPINAVAQRLRISWDEAWGIMSRAVRRGLERRAPGAIEDLGLDETSFQKPHEYVTVLVDRSDGTVIDILDDRKKTTLKGWLENNHRRLQQLRSVSMDMLEAYINAVTEVIEGAERLICFGRFHVAAHFGKAADKVRAAEYRVLRRAGRNPLTRTKREWLRRKANGGYRDKRAFLRLTRLNLKTARAWRIKEAAGMLWSYRYRGVTERNRKRLLGWISRCGLEAMVKVGGMVRRYLWGIINAVVSNVTNARAEGLNSVVQWLKYTARGYRNRERFRTAIYFHLGGLDLYPAGLNRPSSTH